MGASPFLAIDFGASHVTCAQWCRGANGKLLLQRIEREPLDIGGHSAGRWQTAMELAMAPLARRNRWRGPVHLVVPGDIALVRRVTTPRVLPSKLAAVAACEASRCIPYPLEKVEWDYLINAQRTDETEMLVMAAKAEPVGGLCAALAANGLEAVRAIPPSLALAHAFRLAYPEIRSAVLVAVGARTTHVVLIEDGRVLPRTLPLAGNALTEAIAERLGVDVSRAEAVKLQHLDGSAHPPAELEQHAWVIEAARQFAGRLGQEISRSLASAREQAFAATPDGVYLTGGGAFDTLYDWFRKQLALPVHRLDPLRNGVVVEKAGGPEVSVPALVEIVGVAAASVDAASRGNLLPVKWRSAAQFRRRQPVMLAIAALAVAALLPPIWHYDREVRRARIENAAISAQLCSIREDVVQHETAVAGLKELRQQCDALRRLAESQTNWLRFFAGLQESLVEVEDVWLDRLDVVVADEPATVSNGAAEPCAQPLLRLRLCGRMLDRQKVESVEANKTEARVQQLLASLKRSHFVQRIEAERFDIQETGILRFEFAVAVRERSFF